MITYMIHFNENIIKNCQSNISISGDKPDTQTESQLLSAQQKVFFSGFGIQPDRGRLKINNDIVF